MADGAHKILVVGLVRNGEASVAASLATLARALAWNADTRFLVVESDSSDNTLDILRRLQAGNAALRVATLGALRDRIPDRMARIAHCRNDYLAAIRTDPAYADLDYVVVADLDGINSRLTAAAVRSCFERSDWDVCTANQNGPYYDIYALRHPIWCPDDWWVKEQFFRDHGVGEKERVRAACHALMVTLDPGADWIEVDSAFGGLAIYRAATLRATDARYTGYDGDGRGVCEHVPFHRRLRAAGARIFINPRLLNADYTEHTRQLVGKEQAAFVARATGRIVTFQFKRLVRRLFGRSR